MKEAEPSFSIIVPVYNRAAVIAKTIVSILSQSYQNFELIIVDDGSTDETATLLLQWSDPRIRYFHTENGERGAARNFGTSKARGKYINFFDSDDLVYPHHLETAAAFAAAHNDPEFFHVGYDILNESGERLDQEANFNYSVDQRLIYTNFLGCDSVFLKRTVAIACPFNEDRRLASSEDWELWLRIISRYPLISCNEVTLAMIQHSGRSLLTISPDSVVVRDRVLMESLAADKPFLQKYGHQFPLFCADRFTFFALIFSLERHRASNAFGHLVNAFKASPKVLKRRRFWASLRHIILNSTLA